MVGNVNPLAIMNDAPGGLGVSEVIVGRVEIVENAVPQPLDIVDPCHNSPSLFGAV